MSWPLVFRYLTEGNHRLLNQAGVVVEAVGVHEVDESGHPARVGDIFDAVLGRSGYAGALARFYQTVVVQREDCALAHLGNPLIQQSPQSAFAPAALGHSLVEGTAATGMVVA